MNTPKASSFLRAALLLAIAVAGVPLAQSQKLTTLYSFTGTNGDGEYPFPNGRLAFDASGALYGTTASGGTGYNGTVYQLVPNGSAWTENVLYRFAEGRTGASPA